MIQPHSILLECLTGYKTYPGKIEQGVYELWHIETNRVYIGSTTNLRARLITHFGCLSRKVHANRNMQDVYTLSKEFKLVFHPVKGDKKDLILKEQCLMDKYFLQGNILNIAKDAEVGARGRAMTEGQRWLLLKINTGRIKSPEEREKLRQGRLGKIQSPEAREKIRQSKLGKKLPEWHRQIIIKANTGRKPSKEEITKMKENHWRNTKISVNGKIYRSMSEAAAKLELTTGTIRGRVVSKNECYSDYIRL